MADSKTTILKEIKSIEKSIQEAIKSRQILVGNVKDELSDKLDKLNEKIDDLNDEDKINDASGKSLKTVLKKTKSKLDVDLED